MSRPLAQTTASRHQSARARTGLATLLVSVLLAACSHPVGPDYVRPGSPVASQWSSEAWHAARPADDQPRGAWWTLFNDPVLNQFEEQALAQNLDLQAALARVTQAMAQVTSAQATLAPQIAVGGSAARNRTSANRPYSVPGLAIPSTTQNEFNLSGALHWESDLAGGVRRNIEAVQAAADQASADAQTERLLLSANVANTYLMLRALDVDTAILTRLAQAQEEQLTLLRKRRAAGQANALDIASAEGTLENARTQLALQDRTRAPLLTSLAVLLGKPAPDFRLEPGPLPDHVPLPPLGVPSDLLERRPDVASAERAVAQSSALIGVATAARYPSFTLSAGGGLDSRLLSTLLQAPSVLWSIGAGIAATAYDGGRIDANIAAARAAQDVSVARYRETVLTAMGEVESALRSEHALDEALQAQQRVVDNAHLQRDLVGKERQQGRATALDALVAELVVANAERGFAQLQGERLEAAVYLVRSLGGDWKLAAAGAGEPPAGAAP